MQSALGLFYGGQMVAVGAAFRRKEEAQASGKELEHIVDFTRRHRFGTPEGDWVTVAEGWHPRRFSIDMATVHCDMNAAEVLMQQPPDEVVLLQGDVDAVAFVYKAGESDPAILVFRRNFVA